VVGCCKHGKETIGCVQGCEIIFSSSATIRLSRNSVSHGASKYRPVLYIFRSRVDFNGACK